LISRRLADKLSDLQAVLEAHRESGHSDNGQTDNDLPDVGKTGEDRVNEDRDDLGLADEDPV
jgi:hypothetical protein